MVRSKPLVAVSLHLNQLSMWKQVSKGTFSGYLST
jgi:hypothetical protein